MRTAPSGIYELLQGGTSPAMSNVGCVNADLGVGKLYSTTVQNTSPTSAPVIATASALGLRRSR